jgi:DNA repair protein RecO (recombination protein O)
MRTSACELKSAYVLHVRPYRETSLLVNFFSLEQGYITVNAHGVRGSRLPLKGLLQPFFPLFIHWSERQEWLTLKLAEPKGPAHRLQGRSLLSGLYLNEMLVRLLARFDPHPGLYHTYHETLLALEKNTEPEPFLRHFELRLLQELGYGLALQQTIAGEAINPSGYYLFKPGTGLMAAKLRHDAYLFKGEHLLAIHGRNFADPMVLKEAKRLLRMALKDILENRPVNSRDLFI